MKQCTFSYRPTFIYLHICDSIEDIENKNFENYAESAANSTGTCEYKILVDNKVVFEYKIPVNHSEEEDLTLDELEGKILVREINVYSTQSIDAFYDGDENLEPSSVYNGLAYSFNGIIFGDEEDEINELEEYDPEDNEAEETYYEYYLIKHGKPKKIDAI